MSEIWKPLKIDVYQSWCDAIVDEASDDLNDWELRFIGDIQVKLAAGWNLTEAQAMKLESIYAEKTK